MRIPSRLPFSVVSLLLASVVVCLAQSAPAPTPTPRPRLTGGFGRTPVAREAEPEPEATPVAEDAPGSSLHDAVKAASDAKAKKAKPAVSITNQTLVTNPQKGKLTTYSVTPAPTPARAAASESEKPAEGGGAASPSRTSIATGDETYWRQTSRAARARVEDLKTRIAELDAAAKRMESDFYSWDDGQYRDRVIKPAWDKTREELETARQDLIQAEQDLADLPDRARKAGALPGWLRE
ncbi:MAG TPA: hypothetical protein VIE39_01190 [Thermoanaerobaculia bacterium]